MMNVIDYISDIEKLYFEYLDDKTQQNIISSSENYIIDSEYKARCFWETRGWDVYLSDEIRNSIVVNKNRFDKLKNIFDERSIG